MPLQAVFRFKNKSFNVKLDRFTIRQAERCDCKTLFRNWAEGDLSLGNNSEYRIDKKSELSRFLMQYYYFTRSIATW